LSTCCPKKLKIMTPVPPLRKEKHYELALL
jgi:hypothetical protein